MKIYFSFVIKIILNVPFQLQYLLYLCVESKSISLIFLLYFVVSEITDILVVSSLAIYDNIFTKCDLFSICLPV